MAMNNSPGADKGIADVIQRNIPQRKLQEESGVDCSSDIGKDCATADYCFQLEEDNIQECIDCGNDIAKTNDIETNDLSVCQTCKDSSDFLDGYAQQKNALSQECQNS